MAPVLSDHLLARAAAAGSEQAAASIFARHHAGILRYCRSIVLDPHDAEDAAQATMVAAVRALRGTGPRPQQLKPWLYGIAHREALAVLRSRPAAGPSLDDVQIAAPADDPETRERLRELLEDLRGLPERQRGALVLRELSGLGYDEIAAALDMSPQAARQTVFAARTGLRDVAEGRDADCDGVRLRLTGGDRRTARGRVVRAHLRSCHDCASWAQADRLRRRDLALLFPAPTGIGLAVAGLGLGGTTTAATGGWVLASGLSGGGAATCAAICAAAAIVGGGAMVVQEPPSKPAKQAERAEVPAPRDADRARAVAAAEPAAVAASPLVVQAVAAERRAAVKRTERRRTARRAAARERRETRRARERAASAAEAVPASVVADAGAAKRRSAAPTTSNRSAAAAPTVKTAVKQVVERTQTKARDTVSRVGTQVRKLVGDVRARLTPQLEALRQRLRPSVNAPGSQ